MQAPPSFDDDDNKAAVRTKISQTDGMQVDAASTRDSFLLKLFNVGNGDDLENQLVIYLAIEGQTNPKALYGCTSGGTNHAGKYSKAKRERASRIWKSNCSFNFYYFSLF